MARYQKTSKVALASALSFPLLLGACSGGPSATPEQAMNVNVRIYNYDPDSSCGPSQADPFSTPTCGLDFDFEPAVLKNDNGQEVAEAELFEYSPLEFFFADIVTEELPVGDYYVEIPGCDGRAQIENEAGEPTPDSSGTVMSDFAGVEAELDPASGSVTCSIVTG